MTLPGTCLSLSCRIVSGEPWDALVRCLVSSCWIRHLTASRGRAWSFVAKVDPLLTVLEVLVALGAVEVKLVQGPRLQHLIVASAWSSESFPYTLAAVAAVFLGYVASVALASSCALHAACLVFSSLAGIDPLAEARTFG